MLTVVWGDVLPKKGFQINESLSYNLLSALSASKVQLRALKNILSALAPLRLYLAYFYLRFLPLGFLLFLNLSLPPFLPLFQSSSFLRRSFFSAS